jgi:hypothetical protein
VRWFCFVLILGSGREGEGVDPSDERGTNLPCGLGQGDGQPRDYLGVHETVSISWG